MPRKTPPAAPPRRRTAATPAAPRPRRSATKPPPPNPRLTARATVQEVYRETILAAAERVFGQQGLGAVKMVDIAREAGISVGTLYNYFESKDTILCALFEHSGAVFAHRLEGIVEGEHAPLARLTALLTECLTSFEQHSGMFQVIFQLTGDPMLAAPHFIGDKGRELRLRFQSIFERTVRGAVDAGILRSDVAVSDLVSFTVGVMKGFVSSWFHDGFQPGLARKSQLIIDLVLQGAGKRA